MPRVTYAPSLATKNAAAQKIKPQKAIKQEIEKTGQQFHRKSERRRIARDIFFVFEEQPNRRARGSNNKRAGRPKSKFGHLKQQLLKVENPNKKKSLLRDIKNEPQCFLTAASCPPEKPTIFPITVADDAKSDYSSPSIARVNPIFLWVKQDDTRIVEVRCEDYDKRNRIRLTKTTNGWRAVPRTDPASSRIVKLFEPPLLKVKSEVCSSQINENFIEDTSNLTDTEEQLHKINLCQISETSCDESKEEHTVETPFKADNEVNDTIVKNSESLNSGNIQINSVHYINAPVSHKDPIDSSETYQTTTTPKLQLCPETGLFLPHHSNEDTAESTLVTTLSKDVFVDMLACEIDEGKTQVQNFEEDLDSKNLKDLLDDADDLLQHYGDTATNSGADLIDSLVKRSCENNLIQEIEPAKDSSEISSFISSNGDGLTQNDFNAETMTEIIDEVNEPPKSLSFNEAGEIEDLNGELFQSNTYIDTFERDAFELTQENCKERHHTEPEQLPHHSPITNTETFDNPFVEDAPKDLSYKKREEVCPPSESRSQCAVTSSSDVVKSPTQNPLPAIETTSETIKNLILEQFVKLNSLNSLTPSNIQQSEPINLGKHSEDAATSSNFIETVVIDDNSDEEPVKKRQRRHLVSAEENTTGIDKDPDPLTQLQLLIRNTQWKVPDPILVPKDRLSAVLASPAREIPLLITTRPELRLPEAFAFPEIIQNPNILVISMAQLEAILKNEMVAEKPLSQKDINDCSFSSENIAHLNQQHINEMRTEPKAHHKNDANAKCSHAESSLASDINAATLAVLNQMFWLPYFGQLSQDFLKSLKEPVGAQNKVNNFLPLFTHQLGLQHVDEMFKNFIKQISNIKQTNKEPTMPKSTNFANALGALQTPIEMAIFQKMLQHQMHNYMNVNQLSADVPQNETLAKSNFNEHNTPTEHTKVRTSGKETSSPPTTVNCENQTSTGCLTEASKFQSNQKPTTDTKPRLTCKSLSNLLEPECMASSSIPYINLTRDLHDSCNQVGAERAYKMSNCLQSNDPGFRAARSNKVVNPCDAAKLRKRNARYGESTITETIANGADQMNADAYPALWHPLFGSNTKPGYSTGQWQWTTVTATGE